MFGKEDWCGNRVIDRRAFSSNCINPTVLKDSSMADNAIKIGARFQKASPSQKIFRVISTVKPSGHPAHARLVAEVDATQVITVAVSSLQDPQFWNQVD